jgi:Tol biopolymer transport system component
MLIILRGNNMKNGFHCRNTALKSGVKQFLCLFLLACLYADSTYGQDAGRRSSIRKTPSSSSEINLKDIPYKIVYESYRRTEGTENWEIIMNDTNDSNQVNLTKTPDSDEMYPHVSPDGTKICFVVDAALRNSASPRSSRGGADRRNKVRSVYYMNIDGSNRVEVARNGREPCWSPDGKKIAYLRGEFDRYNQSEYATAGLVIYDLETRKHQYHPNPNLTHMYAICWSPDGNWFLGVIKGNSQYSDAILAIEANGMGVFNLGVCGVKGCRPDFSKDGRQITWGETDWDLNVGTFSITPQGPVVGNIRKIVNCGKNSKVYHVDFSPDSRYIIFSYGPSKGGQQVGGLAKGWDICISDLSGKWYQITKDGNHNKEPDWVPVLLPDKKETSKPAAEKTTAAVEKG